jgi:oleate hydratase
MTDRLDAPASAAPGIDGRKIYMVGGGIAALAAAAFVIRDGGVPGRNIAIIEELGVLGGSLDGAGSPDAGYVATGFTHLTVLWR